MPRSTYILVFTVFSGIAAARATAAPIHRVVLVGDSTMARRSGYGDALCARFNPKVDCVSLAKGGRSSKSYRAEGSWTAVQSLLSKQQIGTQYVHSIRAQRSTGQRRAFYDAHGDSVNLRRYVDEVCVAWRNRS